MNAPVSNADLARTTLGTTDVDLGDESLVLVFSSSKSGLHRGGTAAFALKHFGAEDGVSRGLCGRSYAIPTMTHTGQSLPVDVIQAGIREFLEFARSNPQRRFLVSRIGCAPRFGMKDPVICSWFDEAPANCSFEREWESLRSARRATLREGASSTMDDTQSQSLSGFDEAHPEYVATHARRMHAP